MCRLYIRFFLSLSFKGSRILHYTSVQCLCIFVTFDWSRTIVRAWVDEQSLAHHKPAKKQSDSALAIRPNQMIFIHFHGLTASICDHGRFQKPAGKFFALNSATWTGGTVSPDARTILIKPLLISQNDYSNSSEKLWHLLRRHICSYVFFHSSTEALLTVLWL